MKVDKSNNRTQSSKLENYLRTIFGLVFLSAICIPIGVYVFNLGAYLINSKSEKIEYNPKADLGGGLYLGASEYQISRNHRFGNSETATDYVGYKTTEYTRLYGVKFDEAEISLSSSTGWGVKGDAKISAMYLKKEASAKELRKFAKDLIYNIRTEAGLQNGTGYKFDRHYTLLSDDIVIEMTYDGFFKHYIMLKVMKRYR
jgi:hypothetical protein